MSFDTRRMIALGNLVGELKTSLEDAASAVGVGMLLTREPAKAALELERGGAVAVLVDMATLGAEQFCKRARSSEKLKGVPIIGMSRTPSELGFSRVFGWGADDLVPLGATVPLERRLRALIEAQPSEANAFGQAVVAEGTTQRRALVGRVLLHAGYDVKFAVDRASVELYASQPETRIVVVSATLGDPRKLIEGSVKAGGLATWIVTAEARSVSRLAANLEGLPRVAVTSTSGSPEDVLFLANEIVFGKGSRPREWRALYGTPVAFRQPGGSSDDYGFTYDVSPSGVYVRSLLPCESDEVEVDLRPPGREERLRLAGRIVRRFPFGSGAVASAPPGFGVKLTGPNKVALAQWTQACEKYIELERSKPPDAAAPEAGAGTAPRAQAPVALAVPPATLTIESVVAPLPDEHTDVAELMSETLGDEAVPEAGARPVRMDPEGGVREERPSEYMIPAPVFDAGEPEAAPKTQQSTPEPEPAPARPPSRPPLPMPMAPIRDEDDKTTVYERPPSDPNLAAPAAAPADTTETAEPPPALELGDTPAKPAELAPPGEVSPDSAGTPKAKSALGKTLLMQRPAPVPLSAQRPLAPPPPRARPATETAAARAPDESAKAAGAQTPVGTVIVPRDKTLPSASLEAEAAIAAAKAEDPPTGGQPPKAETQHAAVPAPGVSGAATPSVAEARPERARSVAQTQSFDPRGFAVPAPAPELVDDGATDAWFDEAPTSSVGTPPAREPRRSSAAPKTRPRSRAGLVALGAVVLAAVAVGGLALRSRTTTGQHAAPVPVPPRPNADGAVARIAAPESARAVPTGDTSAWPPGSAAENEDAPTSAGDAGSAPGAGTASSKAPGAAGDGDPPASLPSVPPADFDLEAIPGDRAALLVRSSAAVRVFVHGRDYGETNRYLLTSCGIRFVRLGRGFNDFIEPGRSFVVKCGKLTELAIEPEP